MADRLTKDQKEEIRRVFDLFDKDRSGGLNMDKLSLVMLCMGQTPSETELKELMAEFDVNKNGEIEFDEFLAVVARKMLDETRSNEYLLEAFKIFDRDSSGFISIIELKHVVTNLESPPSDENLAQMIKTVDRPDGKANYVEFAALMALQTLDGCDAAPDAVWSKFTSSCQICNTAFSFFFRMHHCRRCGRCVCSNCAPSTNMKPILEWDIITPVLHCKQCFIFVSEDSEKSAPVFEWRDVSIGDLLPVSAVISGKTTNDGDVYVCRDQKGELGKVNVNPVGDPSKGNWSIHKLWCRTNGQSTKGQVLVLLPGSKVSWKPIRFGDRIPSGAVKGGKSQIDGTTYVARTNTDGECGKLTVSGGTLANKIYVHSAWFAINEGDVLCIHAEARLFEWRAVSRGDLLPDSAIKAGATAKDGDVYVCRDQKDELGKLNVNPKPVPAGIGLSVWNIWCPSNGKSSRGEVLVSLAGAIMEWKQIRKGDRLPRGAVRGGYTAGDGQIYVARTMTTNTDCECGKLSVRSDPESGKVVAHKIWVHSSWLHWEEGEVLCIHSGSVQVTSGSGYAGDSPPAAPTLAAEAETYPTGAQFFSQPPACTI